MTLRTRYDAGAQRLPGALPKLQQVRDRKPWQVTSRAQFPTRKGDVAVHENPDIKDERGLYVRSVTMAAGARMIAPAPADGAGQYVIALKGTLVYERPRQALAVVFNAPHDEPFCIQAGTGRSRSADRQFSARRADPGRSEHARARRPAEEVAMRAVRLRLR